MMRLLLLLCGLLFINTATLAQHNIQGTWQVDWQASVAEFTTSDKALYDSLREEQRTRLSSTFASRTYAFNDSTVTINFEAAGAPQSATGTWQLTGEDQLQLTISGRSSAYRIVFINENRSVLQYEQAAPNFLPKVLILNRQL